MLKTRHRAVSFAALVSACLLVACDDAPTESKQTPPPTNKKMPAPKVANLAPDMVSAVSAGKTGDIISIHFALRASPMVNKALPVEVAIVPHRKFGSIRVHFESQDGLAATVGDNFGPQADVEAETALTHQLVLLPTKEGMFMVTSSVETDSEDGNVTRVFSIPIIVAPAKN